MLIYYNKVQLLYILSTVMANCNDIILLQILWVILRFFLLMVELSVLVFGIAFGRLDSKASVMIVLAVTTTIAFVYSIIQV